jgi:hypothetical protein
MPASSASQWPWGHRQVGFHHFDAADAAIGAQQAWTWWVAVSTSIDERGWRMMPVRWWA